MAYRNLKMIMPAIDDFILQVLGMSEAQYEGAWIIGRSQYDVRRPVGWPTAFTLLAYYGFMPDVDGWRKVVALHIGIDVITSQERFTMQGADRVARSWKLADKPDYTATSSEAHEAMHASGLSICVETYQRTGRMILR